jgi:hypothetical protein
MSAGAPNGGLRDVTSAAVGLRLGCELAWNRFTAMVRKNDPAPTQNHIHQTQQLLGPALRLYVGPWVDPGHRCRHRTDRDTCLWQTTLSRRADRSASRQLDVAALDLSCKRVSAYLLRFRSSLCGMRRGDGGTGPPRRRSDIRTPASPAARAPRAAKQLLRRPV